MNVSQDMELENKELILSKKFYKKLANERDKRKRELIVNKMKSFEIILLKSKSKSDIPKAIWIRRIVGTNIYKFRVNSGDRILFQYIEGEDENRILFLDFCNHDSQIRTAKNQVLCMSTVGLEIDDKYEYKEDDFDKEIDEEINNDIYGRLETLKQNSVIEDEYICVSIDEGDMEFLSFEQYECISNRNKQSDLILGCAGSGKTVVAIRKLILNKEENLKSIYITCSNMIVDRVKNLYYRFIEKDNMTSFYTLRNLCFEIIGLKNPIIIEYKDFYEWFFNYALVKEYTNKVDVREIWIEIFSLIKGTAGKKQNSKELEGIISEDEYYNSEESHHDLKTRKIIYRIARIYQYWLKNNKYYDDNDLAMLSLKKITSKYKYDYVIYDEIQDLTELQLNFIYSIARNVNNIMLIGDIDQSINISKLNLDFLKNMTYESNSKLSEKFIIKNYRNGSETINWINAFKQIKFSKFKSMGKNFEQEEEYIKEGTKPKIIYNVKNQIKILSNVDEDVNSIIIVPDESDKKELENMGYTLGRVFSVEDVRGLEYDNIYCYNILSKFNYIWEKVLSNNSKLEDIYRIYFNMVYIAVTRAKNKVVFIEKNIPVLDSILGKHWDKIDYESEIAMNANKIKIIPWYKGFVLGTKSSVQENEFDEDTSKAPEPESFKESAAASIGGFIGTLISGGLVGGILGIEKVDEWSQEAEKLEKTENHYQAAYAYKKAGREADAQRCLREHEVKLNYEVNIQN